MSDETEKPGEAQATPNRGRRREAPIIEGEAIAASGADDAPASPPPAPAPARTGVGSALPGLAALLLSGVALYFALAERQADTPSPEAVAALGQRIDAVETRLKAAEAKPAPAQPDLGPLSARIAALEGRPAPAAPDLGPLAARLAAAEKAAEDARATARRALETAQTPPKPPEAPRVDLSPLEQRVAKIEAELAPLREALAAPKTEVRATESPNVQGVAPNDAAGLAIVADSLQRRIERGAPFSRELNALENLGADSAALSKLKPLAANGAPSTARLAQDFSEISSAMLRVARPAPADESVVDRIARSAASLVRIRPAGENAGEDAPALIGRIESALQRGDVAGALALHDRLPAEVKEPAREWATRARQRAEAEAAARNLLDEALDKIARK